MKRKKVRLSPGDPYSSVKEILLRIKEITHLPPEDIKWIDLSCMHDDLFEEALSVDMSFLKHPLMLMSPLTYYHVEKEASGLLKWKSSLPDGELYQYMGLPIYISFQIPAGLVMVLDFQSRAIWEVLDTNEAVEEFRDRYILKEWAEAEEWDVEEESYENTYF